MSEQFSDRHLHTVPTLADLETFLHFASEDDPRLAGITKVIIDSVKEGNITIEGGLEFFTSRVQKLSDEQIAHMNQALEAKRILKD